MKAMTQDAYLSDLESKLCDLDNLIAITATWAEAEGFSANRPSSIDGESLERLMFLIYKLRSKISDLKIDYYIAAERGNRRTQAGDKVEALRAVERAVVPS